MIDNKKPLPDVSQSESEAVNRDNELLLAQKLSGLEVDEALVELPETLIAQLLPEELEQFVQAQEGLAILKQAAVATSEVEHVTTENRASETPGNSPSLDADPVPKRIGRFQIKEELGQGGFGIVLRARDPRLGRDVALKIPRASSLLHPELLKRFKREARAAALLSHPGIVPIFETDRIGPVHYIAYEYVDGKTLSELIRSEGSIEPKLAAQFARELAEAVQYAHSRGLIHRDLKPANVLVANNTSSAESNSGKDLSRLRITDFGLVDLCGETESLTAENALIGTPSYMSPEQVEGKPATKYSDLFSLGVILYELLTGRVPFRGESNLQTVRMIVDNLAVPPHRHNPQIPGDLSAICMKCLEKRPEHRYESGRDLADDLTRFLDSKPVEARQITYLENAWRWAMRNPMLSLLATSIFLLAIGSTLLWMRTKSLHDESTERLALANQRTSELESAIDAVREELVKLPEYSAIGIDPVLETMLEKVDHYYALLAEESPADPTLQEKKLSARLDLARIKLKLSDVQGARKIAAEVVQSLTDNHRNRNLDYLSVAATLVLADVELKTGNPKRSSGLIQTGVARAATWLADNPSSTDKFEYSKVCSEAADLFSQLGFRAESHRLALESIEIWGSNREADLESIAPRSVARAYLTAGLTFVSSEASKTARPFLLNAVSNYRQLDEGGVLFDPTDRWDFARALYYFARSDLANDNHAVPLLERAAEILDDLKRDHPRVVKYMYMREEVRYQHGLNRTFAGDAGKDREPSYAKAVELFETARKISEASAITYPTNAGNFESIATNSLTMLGILYGKQGDHEAQLMALRNSVEQNLKRFERNPRTDMATAWLGARGSLARCLHRLDRNDEAIETLEYNIAHYLEILREEPGEGQARRFLGNDLALLSAIYDDEGDSFNALNTMWESLEYSTGRVLMSRENHVILRLVELGRLDDALDFMNDVIK